MTKVATAALDNHQANETPSAVRVFLPRSHVCPNADEQRAFGWNAFRRPASRAPTADRETSKVAQHRAT
jgi:hypothetical protein